MARARSYPLNLDLSNAELFGNEAGEDEDPEVLSSYFVKARGFGPFFDESKPLCIVRSRKGMGKSALLSKLAYDLRSDPSKKRMVITTTGADLVPLAKIPESSNWHTLQYYWKQILCARVNVEIGKGIGLALSDDSISLVESAELSGFKGRNLLGALIARVSTSKLPMKAKSLPASNHVELMSRVVGSSPGDPVVWLLIDDVDSKYADSDEERERIAAFFAACRSLAHSVKGLRIRTSVRTDVWTLLRKNEDLDKHEQYMIDISWKKAELKRIFAKKVLSYVHRHYPNELEIARWSLDTHQDQLFGLVFVPVLRWAGQAAHPFRPLKILSAGRPRWMAQLCRMAGLDAYQNDMARIGMSSIDTVMKSFGQYRRRDLNKEHEHQFRDMDRLIEAFAGGNPRYNTAELLNYIEANYRSKVGTENIPPVDGFPFVSVIQLARFLYRIGFICIRVRDGGSSDFETFEERPELLQHDTISVAEERVVWEVHPSYRRVLRIRRSSGSGGDD